MKNFSNWELTQYLQLLEDQVQKQDIPLNPNELQLIEAQKKHYETLSELENKNNILEKTEFFEKYKDSIERNWHELYYAFSNQASQHELRLKHRLERIRALQLKHDIHDEIIESLLRTDHLDDVEKIILANMEGKTK